MHRNNTPRGPLAGCRCLASPTAPCTVCRAWDALAEGDRRALSVLAPRRSAILSRLLALSRRVAELEHASLDFAEHYGGALASAAADAERDRHGPEIVDALRLLQREGAPA